MQTFTGILLWLSHHLAKKKQATAISPENNVELKVQRATKVRWLQAGEVKACVYTVTEPPVVHASRRFSPVKPFSGNESRRKWVNRTLVNVLCGRLAH